MTNPEADRQPLVIEPERLDNLWMYDTARDDSPRRRIGRLATTKGSSNMYDLIQGMNILLEDSGRNYPRIGGGVIVKSIRASGLSSTVGLPFRPNLEEAVLPQAAMLGKEVADSGLDDEEKLQRLANMVGTMVAEAQGFNNGNKRTARAMYGRIRYGREDILKGLNDIIHFGPPADIERSVMLQNVARIRAERDGTETPPLLGGVYVDPSVEADILRSAGSVHKLQTRYGESTEKYCNDVDWNKFMLFEELENRVSDKYIRKLLVEILFQEDYAPAVCSLVFDGPCDIFEALNTETIIEIVNTNNHLLAMRLKSFMAVAACGGYFVSIEDSPDDGKARQIVKTKWEPAVAEYVPTAQVSSDKASTVAG